MKRFIILMILSLSTIAAVRAQYFKGGLTGGVNVSQIDGDYLGGYNKFGFQAGGFVNYDITDKFVGLLELKYIQKGKVKTADPTVGETDYFKVVLDYVQLPIIVQYKIGYNFRIELGLGLGYLLQDRFYDGYGKFPNDQLGYKYYEFELASILGISYDLNEQWFFNVRWCKSLIPVTNVLSNDYENPSGDPFYKPGDQFNRSLEFSVGYRFKNEKLAIN